MLELTLKNQNSNAKISDDKSRTDQIAKYTNWEICIMSNLLAIWTEYKFGLVRVKLELFFFGGGIRQQTQSCFYLIHLQTDFLGVWDEKIVWEHIVHKATWEIYEVKSREIQKIKTLHRSTRVYWGFYFFRQNLLQIMLVLRSFTCVKGLKYIVNTLKFLGLKVCGCSTA